MIKIICPEKINDLKVFIDNKTFEIFIVCCIQNYVFTIKVKDWSIFFNNKNDMFTMFHKFLPRESSTFGYLVTDTNNILCNLFEIKKVDACYYGSNDQKMNCMVKICNDIVINLSKLLENKDTLNKIIGKKHLINTTDPKRFSKYQQIINYLSFKSIIERCHLITTKTNPTLNLPTKYNQITIKNGFPDI